MSNSYVKIKISNNGRFFEYDFFKLTSSNSWKQIAKFLRNLFSVASPGPKYTLNVSAIRWSNSNTNIGATSQPTGAR